MPDLTSPPRPSLRLLSEQVAQLWMGWQRTEGGWRAEPPVGAPRQARFAEDPRRASEALALARQRGFHCTVRVLRARDGGAYEVAIADARDRHHARARSLAEAACGALLALCAARPGPERHADAALHQDALAD